MTLTVPSLVTTRLRLRPFDDHDADDLYALHSNPYVLRCWDSIGAVARRRRADGRRANR